MAKLIKIEFEQNKADVYDIEVEDNHNFFANDILAHNCEISLRPHQFCNLTEINAGGLYDYSLNGKSAEYAKREFLKRAEVASFFGTLQAGFTDFHYLRTIWKRNTEKDALIGVGITGICNGDIIDLTKKYPNILKEGAELVKKVNREIAGVIGIKTAARTTTVKPSGSTSCVLGTSSGIHAWHSEFYIRNMQCGVGDDLFNYFVLHHPELIKIMDYDPNSAVIGIPMKAPESAILREHEDAMKMLKRVHMFNVDWVHEGHRRGPNTNNVSATVYLKEDDWFRVGMWMWKNKKDYNGMSVLPYDGGSYKDAPFQDCTEEEYEKRLSLIHDIDLTQIHEMEDNTKQAAELACAGGTCELTY